MSTLQLVGLAIAGYALGNWIRLWISLITSRQHSPTLNQGFFFKTLLAGCVGANMMVWHMIPWWMVLVVNAGVGVVVVIPALIFRAR